MSITIKTLILLYCMITLSKHVTAQLSVKALQLQFTKGPIKSCTINRYFADDTTATPDAAIKPQILSPIYGTQMKDRWRLNKSGDIVEKDVTTLKDSIMWKDLYYYNNNKSKCEVMWVNKLNGHPHDDTTLREQYFCNKNGRIDSLLKWHRDVLESKIVYSYIKNITKIDIYTPVGDTVYFSKAIFYDDKKKRTREAKQYDTKGELTDMTNITFNKQHNPISSKRINLKNEWQEVSTLEVHFLYQNYDKAGNWTLGRSIIRSNGKTSVSIIERKFTYY